MRKEKEAKKMIKIQPRPDNEYRTQEQWIEFFKEKNQRQISMSDIFQIVQDNNTEAIESLRTDFDDMWLVLSDQIIYSKINLSARIIHNAGSKWQKETAVKEIPYCCPTYLKQLLDTDAGLDYIRALLDRPKATKEQITYFFIALSGKKLEKIRFWTPSQSERASRTVRSVRLSFYDFGRFDVGGGGWVDYYGGFSRGVIVPSASQTAKMAEYIIEPITKDFFHVTKLYKVDLATKTCTCESFKFTRRNKLRFSCKHIRMCEIKNIKG